MKLDHRKHECLVQHELPQIDPKQSDDENTKRGRKEYFSNVKTIRRRHVHVGIGVVNPMESPKERNLMVDAMPSVAPGVEQKYGANGVGPCRQPNPILQPVHESKPILVGPDRGSKPQSDKDNRHQG